MFYSNNCAYLCLNKTKQNIMTTKEKQSIRKVQSVLLSIKNGTPKFFNVVQYENLGLVKSVKNWGTDSSGNKVVIDHSFQLTEKGNMYLNTVV